VQGTARLRKKVCNLKMEKTSRWGSYRVNKQIDIKDAQQMAQRKDSMSLTDKRGKGNFALLRYT
jgi:hypothetical protein